jgi:hypothetical protein
MISIVHGHGGSMRRQPLAEQARDRTKMLPDEVTRDKAKVISFKRIRDPTDLHQIRSSDQCWGA